MKIQLADINPDYQLEIKGDEPWLQPFYESFAPSPVDEPCILTGHLKFEMELADTVKVGGSLSVNPLVPCGRCDKTLRWQVEAKVQTRFYEAADKLPNDQELTAGELDAYYIEGSTVDAFAVIVDAVNERIPNYPVLLTEDEEHCRVCLDPIGSQNYEDPAAADASPFAQLKNLKTRH
jgi:uncharacterized metal-binding protein YceD (DUF177 family)